MLLVVTVVALMPSACLSVGKHSIVNNDSKSIKVIGVNPSTGAKYNIELKELDNKDEHYLAVRWPKEICDRFPNRGVSPDDAVLIIGKDKQLVVIYDNPNHKPITYDELIEFVVNDDTNTLEYIEGKFECTEFAIRLHNNAEIAQIDNSVVEVLMEDKNDKGKIVFHVCNMVKVTDRENPVFIDCTGFKRGQVGCADTLSVVSRDGIYYRVCIADITNMWPMGKVIAMVNTVGVGE